MRVQMANTTPFRLLLLFRNALYSLTLTPLWVWAHLKIVCRSVEEEVVADDFFTQKM